MKTLVFEQITDSRFDADIEQLLQERWAAIMTLLGDMDGVHVSYDEVRKLTFTEPENYEQCRRQFFVRKDNKKTTWNDIYKAIDSVKPVPYKFVEGTWITIPCNLDNYIKR